MASATIDNLNDNSHPNHTPGNGVGGSPGTHEQHAAYVGDSSNANEQTAGNSAARQGAAERQNANIEGAQPPSVGLQPMQPI